MKTTTYVRLSLLIPILVWGICLLFFIIASTPPFNEVVSSQSTTTMNFVFLFFAFYMFGIVIWISPYLLLSLILLGLSLFVKARTLIKGFALSPIVMTILTLGLVNLLAIGSSRDGAIPSDLLIKDQGLISFNLLSFVVSLVWGYICVGIGFGIYKLLQHSGIIRDEEKINSVLTPIGQYG